MAALRKNRKCSSSSSSDAHTGLAAMVEDNFFGKTIPQEPSPERMTATFIDNEKTGVKVMDW